MTRTLRVGVFAVLVACGGAARDVAPAPDDGPFAFVIVHAKLFSEVPGADAVAVRGATIAAVGDGAALARRCTGACRLVDAAGGFVMPGFHDAHAHPYSAGESLSRLRVGTASIAGIQAAVRAYAAAHPDEPWILGRGWSPTAIRSWPSAADLDAAESTRPVVLTDTTGHNVWANSAALTAAGVTEATPDPPGGRVVHPLGVLLDAAELLVTRAEPELSDDAIESHIAKGQAALVRLGITAAAESGTETRHVPSLRRHARARGANGEAPHGAIRGPIAAPVAHPASRSTMIVLSARDATRARKGKASALG